MLLYVKASTNQDQKCFQIRSGGSFTSPNQFCASIQNTEITQGVVVVRLNGRTKHLSCKHIDFTEEL